MATRPVFRPSCYGQELLQEVPVSFLWNSGFSTTQKKKNIQALHEAAYTQGLWPLLEISTKSESELGRRLSAFSVHVNLSDGRSIPVECAYQGSKIFCEGGPYTDLYNENSKVAKRDERLRSSGRLIGFMFDGYKFPSQPVTAFYDWLYVQALCSHEEYLKRLREFSGFTDIEFNPKHSSSCQARSLAIYVALSCRGMLHDATVSAEKFIDCVYRGGHDVSLHKWSSQDSLF